MNNVGLLNLTFKVDTLYSSISIYNITTFQREIFYFLLNYIYLTADSPVPKK